MRQPTDLVTSVEVAGAREQLRAVGRRFVLRRGVAVLLPALAAAVVLVAGARHWPAGAPVLAVLGGLGVLLAGWRLWPLRQVSPTTTAPRLDRQFPELEDSTGLLLRDATGLNLLESLQQQRVARQLAALRATDSLVLPVDFRPAGWLTGGLLLLAAGLWWWPAGIPHQAKPTRVAVHFSEPARPSKPGQTPPRISETALRVTPPAYTRLAAFAPVQASFQCPQGARVRWQVRVRNGAGQAAPVLELGPRRLELRPVAGQAGTYFTEQILNASTLYRLRYAGTVSDDYAIDVRPDLAPVLRITTPKPYTLVAALGQRPEVSIRATVRDDYGLSRAELVITVAQGQGEAVKFHELRRDLSAGLSGAQANLNSLLNLPKLGLTYGDELYFYLLARDNNGHTARTDSYLVQWQDTAVADSAPDLGMGVKVAPAYFRSQRQIIIDTDKLLAEKPRLDAATFAARANALGFDQQSLRLRYGKFLGEESEAGIGAPAPHSPIAEDEDAPATTTAEAPEHDDHDHAAPPVSPSKTSPTAETDALMEPYIHKHDDSETADFLEPAVKTKLHAVLDQMWAAELRLRTGQLAAARPYEYRALRLLKEVQQQTRVFVKKAGFTPPPMPEATLRLTGELAGAAAPQRQQMLPAPNPQPAIRAALRWLASAEQGQPTRPADAVVLDQAGAVLAGATLTRPGFFLPALRALREMSQAVRAGRPTRAASRAPAARALTELLATPAPTPAAPPAADRLARRYFQELAR
ncbi:DUF4175 domain-containing protein [Hymenobacter sp. DH14]|uniref:DUF4175 domain-containing protein n=1 Tax=Hymenobacter cyanobacteriorum TaxID=2926463 RepID=A0A9X2AEE6_9BACT|nr:DUF4175 domain-containing protein [Hymenobacter cyanobacteriorum]MCI1187131.1 DUF4175 domain-containing protein [Hymenobacter cyanobacteriorum]